MKPFLSLQKKMKDYIKERQPIDNPFVANRKYPSRPKPSPSVKRPKTTPVKRSNPVTKGNIEKLYKLKKGKCGIPPQISTAELACH